jgi:MFS family permease
MTWSTRLKQAKAVAIVSSGNFFEMYDFMVFGYFASAIAKAYFPAGNEFASLMLTLMTFGAGFLMRPVGAVFLGAYIDRHGRRKGLLITLAMMAAGTLIIAVTPTYATIGLAAPLLVLLGRLIQGLSAGAESGGVAVYLSEIAPLGKKGFYSAWQSAIAQVSVIAAAGIGWATNTFLAPVDMAAWGWRIPFLVGCLLAPLLLLMRRQLEESEAFKAQEMRPDLKTVCRTLMTNWHLVVRGMLMTVPTTVFFYMITAYTPTFGARVLNLTAEASFTVILYVGLLNFILVPVMGALSDRIGRLPMLIGVSMLGLVTAYPLMHWLVAAPSFERLLIVLLFFAFVFSSYNGALIAYLTEIMPAHVRTSGFSVAFSLATALFGGFTPAIATYLIGLTGDRAIPGAWLMFAAFLGLSAALSFAVGSRKQASCGGVTAPKEYRR